MVDRDRIIAALDAWRDAEKAYRDDAAKYVGAWWLDGGPLPERKPEPLTREALAELTRLQDAAGAALAAYRDVLGER
jgi:hypothetical protein